MRKNLTRGERIRKKKEFTRVFDNPDYKEGCRGAKLVARRNDLSYNRFAAGLVRKFGNAVERNRSRRFLKEIYRNAKEDLSKGFDIIVVLYPGKYSLRDREHQFWTLFRRAGLVKTDR